MLLVHQIGSVKVGEVARYTLTYTPSLDRILPPPTDLHVKVRNTSAIPLRAAYLHGPYTLYAAAYPSTFNPNVKHEDAETEGSPDYEPQLKAGGSWTTKLKLPSRIRDGAESNDRNANGERKQFTWLIEVASQVLFSTTATVHYEIVVGRDEKSVASGLTGAIQVGGKDGLPGKLEDFQTQRNGPPVQGTQVRGVFTKAVSLTIDDTETLWNQPPFPSWDVSTQKKQQSAAKTTQSSTHATETNDEADRAAESRKQRKIHLVILTHGLHSNLGADMLYIKESIDAAAKQAREDVRQKRMEVRAKKAQEANQLGRDALGSRTKSLPDVAVASTMNSRHEEEGEDDNDDEHVLVRGFNGNAVKTEKGIQYLGKRLAKYVLSITYPDQPYLPTKSSMSKQLARRFTGDKERQDPLKSPTHKNSTIIKDEKDREQDLAYKITSISFIGHSLGGLIQTYAVAYIQKHSPEFFDLIKPVNFVAMASPFLGLSNENPVYVKFALDFGLVGRTGQDLGLTWRPPTIARNGWGAMMNQLVNDPHKEKKPDPQAKPLLRILPTGPAHQALKMFRNRTVYSNVVNDGIVPLRTSCLLFLDWRGLGRVEKARRDNGLVGTMVNWGWMELIGENASAARKPLTWNSLFADSDDDNDHQDAVVDEALGSAVPQAEASTGLDYDQHESRKSRLDSGSRTGSSSSVHTDSGKTKEDAKEQTSNAWTAFISYFKPQGGAKPKKHKPKHQKMLRRGQTMNVDDEESSTDASTPNDSQSKVDKPWGPVRGSSLYKTNSGNDNLEAPPKTTVFESAGDLLNPPLPSKEFLLDPSSRPRTIFHDRVYHPDDIPPPPVKRRKTFMSIGSSRHNSVDMTKQALDAPQADNVSRTSSSGASEVGSMKIEEKIARAYHKDMSWRKVLVRLEPDAHNNMIVRRMFANAYGWPVVKHMCDTHFAYTEAAQTRDEDETCDERAQSQSSNVRADGANGEQVKDQVKPPSDDKIAEQDGHSPGAVPLRAKTMNPVNEPNDRQTNLSSAQIEEMKTLHHELKEKEEKQNREARSPSEVRESRDQISDLISRVNAQGQSSTSYDSLHSSNRSTSSASAALHRLQRQDSARWSDRFFDGSDDDDDDDEEDGNDGNRSGQGFKSATQKTTRGLDHADSRSMDAAGSAQDQRDSIQPRHILDDDNDRVVAEPDELNPNDDQLSPDKTRAASIPDPQTLSMTSVGMGVSVPGAMATEHEDRISPRKGHRQRGSSGSSSISRQVAAATAATATTTTTTTQ